MLKGGTPLKIAIIGGGPAGLTAAIEGVHAGLEIELFEQYKIGGNIRCAEAFFDGLNILGEPEEGVRFKVEKMNFKINNTYSFNNDEQTNIWMIDRSEWQQALAKEAKELGVVIYEDNAISRTELEELRDKYDYVIDCSGAPSVTSKLYDFTEFYKENSGLTVQYTLAGDFSKYEGEIFAALLSEGSGYYWIFPKSNTEANVGLILFDNKEEDLWKKLDEVLEIEGLTSYEKTRELSGTCPVVRPEKLVYENIIMAGDAAGLISPLHGGGIDNACISGKIAIKCIMKNEVENYGEEINKALGKRLDGEAKFAKLAYQFNRDQLDNLLNLVHSSDKLLGEHAFLNGEGAAFGKFGVIKGIVPNVNDY